MDHRDRPLVWLHGEVRSPPFSAAARIEAGVLLRRLQRGETLPMPHSRPIPANDGLKPMIDEAKQRRLKAQGWQVGSADEFLGLSAEESAYVDLRLRLRLRLSDALRAQRQRQHLTQVELARRIKSSQSRVAKMEAGDASISLDLLIRSLFALGASNRDLAEAINGESATVA